VESLGILRTLKVSLTWTHILPHVLSFTSPILLTFHSKNLESLCSWYSRKSLTPQWEFQNIVTAPRHPCLPTLLCSLQWTLKSNQHHSFYCSLFLRLELLIPWGWGISSVIRLIGAPIGVLRPIIYLFIYSLFCSLCSEYLHTQILIAFVWIRMPPWRIISIAHKKALHNFVIIFVFSCILACMFIFHLSLYLSRC
jgi:hypothetical protein